MRYDPNRYFCAAAIGTAELWRTAAGVVLTFVAGMALYQLCFALVSNLIGPDATQSLIDATTFSKNSAFATLYILFTFGFFTVGLMMVLHSLHHRTLATLIGPWAAALSDFIRVVLAVTALFVLISVLLPQDVEHVANAALGRRTWILLLPLSLTAILVQASTEELVFRGYLQQQLAARFPTLPVWMIVPSLLFGLAHVSPESAGANAPFFALWAVVFALAAADLTARTGTIGAAIGLHAANNIAAILLVSIEGSGSGLALFHLPMSMDDPRIAAMMLPELASTLCAWLTARLVLKV